MNFIEKHIMSKHGEVINQDSIERVSVGLMAEID
jgi:hypothetical protein